MVRLKVVAVFYAGGEGEFQFQYGTVEGARGQQMQPVRACFNSNMVRLKVYECGSGGTGGVFQFQYGTVEGPKSDS